VTESYEVPEFWEGVLPPTYATDWSLTDAFSTSYMKPVGLIVHPKLPEGLSEMARYISSRTESRLRLTED
jgi:hypothetical protein